MHRYITIFLFLALLVALPMTAACTPQEPVDDTPDIQAEENEFIEKVHRLEDRYGSSPSIDKAFEACEKLDPMIKEANQKRLFNGASEASAVQRKYSGIIQKKAIPILQKALNKAAEAYENDSIEAAIKILDNVDPKLTSYGRVGQKFLDHKRNFMHKKKAQDEFPEAMNNADKLRDENKFFEAYDFITDYYTRQSPGGKCFLSEPFQNQIKNRMSILEGEIVKLFDAMVSSEKKAKFTKFLNRHGMDIRTTGDYLDAFREIAKEVGVKSNMLGKSAERRGSEDEEEYK
ncbi:MAG: hypothetical protein ACYS8W_07625 [Planctomycetota bacterium]|jgi:hypothetical protein